MLSRNHISTVASGLLVTIDPNTGIFSFVCGVSTAGGPSLGGLAFQNPYVEVIPTLSEWELIAMAGILGLVGSMVIRRRKATA